MEPQLAGSPLTVCSFNMGSSVGDYMQLCKYQKLSLQFKTREEEEAFRSKYAAVQRVSAEKLIERNCDLYCLQEVGDETRALIDMLKKKNYRIIHLEQEMFDAAIAISQERFVSIVNLSHQVTLSEIFKKDIAMAEAIDSKTGGKVIIVSGHVPGFNFAAPKEDEVTEGDAYCKMISERLAQFAEPTLKIMGMDMNGSPEIAEERFQTFIDTGFQICRIQAPTNVNMQDADQPKRELDYIFVKNEENSSSFFAKLMAPFQKKTASFKVGIASESLLSWDPEQNSSDHLPICATITMVKE